ncbi:MAG: hypothetical protein M3483_07510, partial [Gemmatimonadota bacterium]|nr:hypothetical protein [Gemmatimonadota bacterium]
LWTIFGLVARADTPEEVETLTNVFTFAAAYPLLLVLSIIVWGALIHECSRAVLGEEVDRREAFRVAFRRFFPLLGVMIIAIIGITVGLVFLVVPGVLLAIMLFAIWHVVVLEGKGPLEALGRSRELARGAWLKVFVVWLLATIIISVPGMVTGTVAFGYVAFTMIQAGGVDESMVMPIWLTVTSNLLSTLLSAVTTPFLVAAMTLLYYDRRVRSDALDLEMAAEALVASE